MDRLLGIKQVAERMGISYSCVYNACKSGEISNVFKIGNRWVINATREWPDIFPPADETKEEM